MKTITLEPLHRLSMAVLCTIQGKCAVSGQKQWNIQGIFQHRAHGNDQSIVLTTRIRFRAAAHIGKLTQLRLVAYLHFTGYINKRGSLALLLQSPMPLEWVQRLRGFGQYRPPGRSLDSSCTENLTGEVSTDY